MDTTRAPLEMTMELAWKRLAALMATVCAMMPAGWESNDTPLRSCLRLKLLRLLRPAEALARRLILTMARDLSVAPGKPSITPRAHMDFSALRRAGTPPTSVFSLYESIPPLRVHLTPVQASKCFRTVGPGPRILDLDGSCTLVNTLDGTGRTFRVKIRLTALLTAMKDPAPLARRIARRLLRARQTGTLKRLPLKPGYAPGRLSRHTPYWLCEALRVFTLEIRGWPPPPSVHSYG